MLNSPILFHVKHTFLLFTDLFHVKHYSFFKIVKMFHMKQFSVFWLFNVCGGAKIVDNYVDNPELLTKWLISKWLVGKILSKTSPVSDKMTIKITKEKFLPFCLTALK